MVLIIVKTKRGGFLRCIFELKIILKKIKEVDLKFKILAAIVLAIIFIGSGYAYVNIKTPFDTDLNRTDLGSKKGSLLLTAFCGLYPGAMPVMLLPPENLALRWLM